MATGAENTSETGNAIAAAYYRAKSICTSTQNSSGGDSDSGNTNTDNNNN